MVVIQTLFAPKLIVPLAYDSGGVTTSTITVPLVAGLGLGLAESIPGRSPLIDGFGLIAFASLFPMITVMAYAQASEWRAARNRSRSTRGHGSGSIRGGSTMRFKLLVAFVDDHLTEAVTQRSSGSGGHRLYCGTNARGEGLKKKTTFLGLSLETQRDMVLLLVEEHRARHILETVGKSVSSTRVQARASRFRSMWRMPWGWRTR